MTEAEYDELIAPKLAEIANQVAEMGGNIVARVEWEKDQAGITRIGISEKSGVAQQLTDIAALSRGNIDQIFIEAARRFDMSKTIIGSLMPSNPS